ncbi:MAG: gamma carbonic anhydrase family protein [Chloroflexota bacterium]|nr:gamma carbonic anhydrase family protein [Chloroflexota bacterium]
MPLYPFRGKWPSVASDAWIAPTACLIGDVTVGPGASVWFNATVRADTDRVEIGAGTNVQDNSVVHTDEGWPTIIGANVTIGHGAIVHSSVVEDNVLIGSGSALVGRNRLGAGTIVGAGAVLPEGMVVAPRKLVLGLPAKVVRDAKPEDERWTVDAARYYVSMSAEYRNSLDE